MLRESGRRDPMDGCLLLVLEVGIETKKRKNNMEIVKSIHDLAFTPGSLSFAIMPSAIGIYLAVRKQK
jgi:hypothetical protein